MKGDNSRETFGKEKHYSAVRQQQGRVQVDADWNEHVAIQRYLDTTEGIDVIGPVGAPEDQAGFAITYDPNVDGQGNADFLISPGHIYVDGILCESDMYNDYRWQPHWPHPDYVVETTVNGQAVRSVDVSKLPASSTGYVAYLDVWERHISWVEDDSIREVALGGPDTATRVQTIWRVVLAAKPETVDELLPPFSATLSAWVDQASGQTDACSLAPTTGYRGLENQLYRVEIHEGGSSATYKWSRDNGSVVARWLGGTDKPNTLLVDVAGGDASQRFESGNWVELLGDDLELAGNPGVFVKLTLVQGNVLTFDPNSVTYPSGISTIERSSFGAHPKIRRWDCNGPQKIEELKPLPLEEGILVSFGENGSAYVSGQYWLIPARAATQDIEWPRTETGGAIAQTAVGIHHHVAILGEFDRQSLPTVTDKRPLFPPLTRIHCECSTELPLPGQYRCYQVDPDGGADENAVPGIGMSAVDAVNQANSTQRRFKSLTGVANKIPRTGNDSIAIIMLGAGTARSPGEKGTRLYDEIVKLTGLTGYRRIVIRGSDYSNSADDKHNCGATQVGQFKVDTRPYPVEVDPGSERRFYVSAIATPVELTDPTAWRGARLTFIESIPPQADTDIVGKTLTVNTVTLTDESAQTYLMTTAEAIEDTIGSDHAWTNLQFVVEVPSVRVQSLALQANSSAWREVQGGGGGEGHNPGVAVAGLTFEEFQPSGLAGMELSFIRVLSTNPMVNEPLLSLRVTRLYEDEGQSSVDAGVSGFFALNTIHTTLLCFENAVLSPFSVENCRMLEATGCCALDGMHISNSRASIWGGTAGQIVWTDSDGNISSVMAYTADEKTFFMVVSGTRSNLSLDGMKGGSHGTWGTWLRLDENCKNAKVVVLDQGNLTDILMADDVSYEPQGLTVTDIRDSFGNHIQGAAGCLISESGLTLNSIYDWANSFSVIGLILVAPSSSTSNLSSRIPVIGVADSFDPSSVLGIVGISQNTTNTIGVPDPSIPVKVRVVKSGFVPVRLADQSITPPAVVYLNGHGLVGADSSNNARRIGVLVDKKDCTNHTGSFTVGIVSLD
jgi:Family of unknown function (DUF6519)